MDSKPLQITLIPAPDDLPEESSEYQAQLRAFDETLREDGFEPSAFVELIEAVGHDVTPYIGMFKIALTGSFSALNLALAAYLKEKHGRTVELEVDGIKTKAASVEEVRQLIQVAKGVKERNEPQRILP